MSYFRLVLRRARRDTTLFDQRKVVTSIVVALVALGFQFGLQVRGLPATLQIGGTVVAAYALVALFSFLWNVVASTARIHGEQEAAIEELSVVRATEDDLNVLANYRDDGINLMAKGPALDASGLDAWIADHAAWRKTVIEFLKPRFPKYQWGRFATIGPHPGGRFEGMADRHYQLVMRLFDLEIHRLDDIRNETMASKLTAGQ